MSSFQPTFGWINDPVATRKFVATLAKPTIREAAPHLKGNGANRNVFAWEFEQSVLGRILKAWDQANIGSCVSHGWGRTVQDVMLVQCANGTMDWPGFEVCRENIYGGSRCEVGGQFGDYQDGSVGAWAAKYVSQWGIILYKNYEGIVDLSSGYSVDRCKQWGAKGVPDALEPIAKMFPCKGVMVVQSPEDVADAVCNMHWVAICGNTSRTTKRNKGGWCPKTGNEWAHCEEICGHAIVRGGSNSPFGGDGAFPFAGDTPALVERNSWGDYLGSENNTFETNDGKTIFLPEGCYLSTYDERREDLRGEDSFSVASAEGYPIQYQPWIFK